MKELTQGNPSSSFSSKTITMNNENAVAAL
jgi:hypothetical protein